MLTAADLGALDEEQYEVHGDRRPVPLWKDRASSVSREQKEYHLEVSSYSVGAFHPMIKGTGCWGWHENWAWGACLSGNPLIFTSTLALSRTGLRAKLAHLGGRVEKRLCLVPKSRTKNDALEISSPGSGTMTPSQPPVSAACRPKNGPL